MKNVEWTKYIIIKLIVYKYCDVFIIFWGERSCIFDYTLFIKVKIIKIFKKTNMKLFWIYVLFLFFLIISRLTISVTLKIWS